MAKNFKVNTKVPPITDIDREDSTLNLYDINNPDISFFNLIDDEVIKLSGLRILYHKYNGSEDYDPVYLEARDKAIAKQGIAVFGHYDPKVLEESLTQFGIELTSEQIFVFNKSYIERKIGRTPKPGDILKPDFQNQSYEIYEVQEDAFEAYGVYHVNCSAKLLRDAVEVQDKHLPDTTDPLGGYFGGSPRRGS